MGKRPQQETKPLIMRAIELVRALQIIAYSFQAVRASRIHQLTPLSGQLRALLTERTRRADPLLFELANLLSQPLDVYVMPGTDDLALPDTLQQDAMLQLSGLPVTLKQELPAQRKMDLKSFLQHPILKYKGQHYTAKTVIEWFANWTGGAHYSRLIPADFLELLAFDLMGLQPAAVALLQVGEAVLSAGRDLLKRLVDIELHCVVAVPALPTAASFLFDAAYPGASMRWSILVHPTGRMEFRVVGGQGVGAAVLSDGIVDWSRVRHIHAAVTIDDDLTTVIELFLDGLRVGRTRSREPLFVASDPLHYDICHNRAVDGDKQQFSFALITVTMFSREIDPGERAKMFLWCEEQRGDQDRQCVLCEPTSFGRALPGTKDLTMSGTVRHLQVCDVIPGTGEAGAPA